MIHDERAEIDFESPVVALVSGLIEGGLRKWASESSEVQVIIRSTGQYEIGAVGSFALVTIEALDDSESSPAETKASENSHGY